MLKKWLASKESKKAVKDQAQPNIPGIIPVTTVKNLLEPHQGRIIQINELAGLSSDNFERFYLTAIHRFARFVQQCPASEVHHHAELGGMLSHALDVCVMALKVRRSYLLSESGDAEEISQTQDLWSYAIFIAALCHNLAKVAVDQVLMVYDHDHHKHQWNPWHKFIDEQGLWYTTEFVRNRTYKLHEKASPLLIHQIIPSSGIKWISSNQSIFSKWIASISGDKESQSSIGDIVSIADRRSVAADLGADNSRMPPVKTKPLHEKMVTALRHLLLEGELLVNKNGADAWVLDDDCWLASKRTADTIREQLTQEGHSGVPSKNGRVFDILQEHGVIIPCGDKELWTATVESNEGWRHDLTLIKITTSKLWPNATLRPAKFDGRIIVREIENDHNNNEAENNLEKQAGKTEQEKVQNEKKLMSPDISKQTENSENKPIKKTPYKTLEPLKQEFKGTAEDELDLLAFLPSININEKDEKEKWIEDDNISTTAQKDNIVSRRRPEVSSDEKKRQADEQQPQPTNNIPFVQTNNTQNDVVSLFFNWLQEGIEKGHLKTNQKKARIHVVDEGVILATPGIFQDFAKTFDQDNSSWTTIQKKVLKKNWHARDSKGLNVVKYQVKGRSKKTTINTILFHDAAKIFGNHELPDSNPHLIKLEENSQTTPL